MLLATAKLQVSVPGQAVISAIVSKPGSASPNLSNAVKTLGKAPLLMNFNNSPWLTVILISSAAYSLTNAANFLAFSA